LPAAHTRRSGNATNLYVERPHFEWVRGEELTARFDLPSARSFAGSLDGEPSLEPQARIYWESGARWACSGGVPRFEAYPEWWK
jgi:hypothetical protein